MVLLFVDPRLLSMLLRKDILSGCFSKCEPGFRVASNMPQKPEQFPRQRRHDLPLALPRAAKAVKRLLRLPRDPFDLVIEIERLLPSQQTALSAGSMLVRPSRLGQHSPEMCVVRCRPSTGAGFRIVPDYPVHTPQSPLWFGPPRAVPATPRSPRERREPACFTASSIAWSSFAIRSTA
jgi:hypothetical protein